MYSVNITSLLHYVMTLCDEIIANIDDVQATSIESVLNAGVEFVGCVCYLRKAKTK